MAAKKNKDGVVGGSLLTPDEYLKLATKKRKIKNDALKAEREAKQVEEAS